MCILRYTPINVPSASMIAAEFRIRCRAACFFEDRHDSARTSSSFAKPPACDR